MPHCAALVLLLGAYVGCGWGIYVRFASVSPASAMVHANTPSSFRLDRPGFAGFDTGRYLMKRWEPVRIPSRTEGVVLDGWWVEAARGVPRPAPAVVLVHGMHASKATPSVLVVAGMLHRQGFDTLLIDLRNHGQSSMTDGRVALGSVEYLDVLAAVDWLAGVQAVPAGRIGVWGASMGAATAAIAFAHDERIGAAALDSGFYSFDAIVREELERAGLPGWLAPGVHWSVRMRSSGWSEPGPEGIVDRAAGRAMFVVHGSNDSRVSPRHSSELVALAAARGARITPWIVPGAGHVEASLLRPAEYEQRMARFFRTALRPRKSAPARPSPAPGAGK